MIGCAGIAAFVFPAGGDVMNNLVLAATYVGMALGLNIIVGFAGLLDLGYVAFFAVGAYTAGYLGSGFWNNAGRAGEGLWFLVAEPTAGLPGIHLNSLLILLLAAVATAIAGIVIGLPTLRLRGDYIALVTLAFGEIIGSAVVNGDEIRLFGGTLTAGRKGITPIDKIDLPFIERFGSLDLRPWYWLALALAVAALVANLRLRDSRIGRAWVALREDEVTASSVGVPVTRMKLLAYGTGAAFGGVWGAFLAAYLNTVNADQFEFSFSIFVLAMVVLGGLGSVWGVALGATALSAVNNYLLPEVFSGLPRQLGVDLDLAELSLGIYGFVLVIVMLLRPEGLAPGEGRAGRRLAVLDRTANGRDEDASPLTMARVRRHHEHEGRESR